MKWEEFCISHGIGYANLIDFCDWLNNYTKTSENLDTLPAGSIYRRILRKRSIQKQQVLKPQKGNKPFISAQRKTNSIQIVCPEFLKLSVDERNEQVKQL